MNKEQILCVALSGLKQVLDDFGIKDIKHEILLKDGTCEIIDCYEEIEKHIVEYVNNMQSLIALGYEIDEDDEYLKRYEYFEKEIGYRKYIELYRTECDPRWKVQCYENNHLPATLYKDELNAIHNLIYELQTESYRR